MHVVGKNQSFVRIHRIEPLELSKAHLITLAFPVHLHETNLVLQITIKSAYAK